MTLSSLFNLTHGELGSTRSPRRVFSLMAMDAALNAMQLNIEAKTEEKADLEIEKLLEAVELAAGFLLQLIGCPDDWSEFVCKLAQLRPLPEMTSAATERMFEVLPPMPRTWADELTMLVEIVQESAGCETRLRRAAIDLELHFGLMANQSCEDAFALGFKAAQDASCFLFEQSKGSDDG